LKYACILPLSALAIAVFARPEVAASLEVISNVSVNGLFVPAGDTIITVAPQIEEITAEINSKVESQSDLSFSQDMDVEVVVDDVVMIVDSIRESVRVQQIDDTVIVSVNNNIDTIIVSNNPEDKKIQMEVREIRRRAVREGVRVSREIEKWREEHADEIEAVKKQAEALGKKAAAETRKALKEADKARKEIAKEWRDERARQIREDSLRVKRGRSDSLRAEFANRRVEIEKRRVPSDSLRREFYTKRRVEADRRREEFRQRRNEADRRREEVNKEKEKEKEKAEPENVANKTGLRETAL
jgi:hypothetical protein